MKQLKTFQFTNADPWREPGTLHYGDIVRIVDTETYLLIVQSDSGLMIMVSLQDGEDIEWNRKQDPVGVRWNSLTVEKFKELTGLEVKKVTSKVNITFEV